MQLMHSLSKSLVATTASRTISSSKRSISLSSLIFHHTFSQQQQKQFLHCGGQHHHQLNNQLLHPSSYQHRSFSTLTTTKSTPTTRTHTHHQPNLSNSNKNKNNNNNTNHHHHQHGHHVAKKSFDSYSEPFRSEYYQALRKINRSLYVKAPWNASRQIYIYLKRHLEFLKNNSPPTNPNTKTENTTNTNTKTTFTTENAVNEQDLPTWLTSDLISRICADFVSHPPQLMHKFIAEMSQISENLVDERVMNRLVQCYAKHLQLDHAFAVAFGREISPTALSISPTTSSSNDSSSFTIHKVFQPDLIMLCTVMDGFIAQENYESVIGLFKIIVDYVNRPSYAVWRSERRRTANLSLLNHHGSRATDDRVHGDDEEKRQICAVLSKLILTYGKMNEPQCASYLFSYMLQEHEQLFGESQIKSNAKLLQLVQLLQQLPEFVVRDVRPSAHALNSLVRALVDNGLLEQAFQFAKSCHDFQHRLWTMDGIVVNHHQFSANKTNSTGAGGASGAGSSSSDGHHMLSEVFRLKDETGDVFNLIHSLHVADRFTNVIRGHVDRGYHSSALKVYQYMISDKFKEQQRMMSRSAVRPSTSTIAIMAKSFAQYESLGAAMEFIKRNQEQYGVFIDISVYNEVFEGLVDSGQYKLIQGLFDQLLSNRRTPQQPNRKTNEIIVSCYASAGMIEEAEKMIAFRHKIAPGYRPTVLSYEALVTQYLKAYNFEDALRHLNALMTNGPYPTEHMISLFYHGLVTQGSFSSTELEQLIHRMIPTENSCAKKDIVRSEFLQSIRKIERLKTQNSYSAQELTTILLDDTMARIQKQINVANLHKTNARMERVDRTRALQIKLNPPPGGRNAKVRFAMKKSMDYKLKTKQREAERLSEKQAMWQRELNAKLDQ